MASLNSFDVRLTILFGNPKVYNMFSILFSTTVGMRMELQLLERKVMPIIVKLSSL